MSTRGGDGPAVRSLGALMFSIALLAGAIGLLQREAPRLATGVPADGKRPLVTAEIRMTEYAFAPRVVEVAAGARVRLTLINAGREEHELELEGYDLEVAGLQPGTSVRLIFNADRSGRFEFACHLPGHYERGMHGLLIVRPAARVP
ncbi:MAG TPA: cupredoxin domain-containing protein [Thermaerobacter sp.]